MAELGCAHKVVFAPGLIAATPRQGFPRSARLVDAAQFRRVFERAVRSSDPAFTVLARANQRRYPRLGLAISRKCASRAAARNRVKRLVRESFRAAQHALPPVDLVVLCRSMVNDMTNEELAAALERHWGRLSERCKER